MPKKNYKNYLKNQKARRKDPGIRKIRNGEVKSRWDTSDSSTDQQTV